MRRRRGIALVIALLALIALAGAIAASFYPALEGQRAGARSVRLELMAGAAELGLAIAAPALTSTFLRDHPAIGAIWSKDTLVAGAGPALVSVVVTRTPAGVIWVGGVARAAGGLPGEQRARHLALGELRPRFPRGPAVVTPTNPLLAAGSGISGNDVPPPGWTDCAAPAPAAPPLRLVADSLMYGSFGPDSLGSLLAAATSLPDSAAGPLPASPVLLAGDGTVVGPGSGAGILVAPGSLRIVGPFDFAGVIVARGPLHLGDGVHVSGVVLAASTLTLAGTASVERSDCAVEHAERGLSRLATGHQWRWGISY